ncbi:MAG: oligosaccharide flippase family protein [Gemmatimonadaceae bacterium]|nr:oligosaccharide flippase family protein [Gemmatimonadaceae bacterium]
MTSFTPPFTRDPATGSGSKSARSGVVVVVGRAAQLVLQFGLAILLARLLSPEDFGVQAMVFPVALLVQGIANSGLQSAIIQHESLDDVQASALFWASLRWNALLCAGMAASGVLLMAINREPRVLPVTIAWAAITLGATLSAIHEALLKRQFRFGAVLGAHLTGLVLSIGVAVVAARLGARHWAIILQMAVVEFVRVAIVWRLLPWRPLSPVRLGPERHAASAELRAYWRGFAGARFMGWMSEQADRIAVGVMGGAAPLGLYDFARRWGQFAFVEVYTPLSEVAIATLSAVRRDAEAQATQVRNAFLPVLAISLPILGFLFAEADGVLLFLFGAQWVPAAPAMRAIAVATAVGSIGRLAYWVSLSTGQTTRQFRWTVIITPVFLAGILVGARWGPFGVAVGFAVANLLTSIPGVFYLLATTSLRVRPLLATWTVPMLAAVGGVAALRLLDPSLPSSGRLVGLVERGFVFLATYVVLWLLIPGGRGMLRGLRPSARAT